MRYPPTLPCGSGGADRVNPGAEWVSWARARVGNGSLGSNKVEEGRRAYGAR